QVLRRVLVATVGDVAHARLVLAHARELSPLRAVDERGEDLAGELPALEARAVDRREARGLIAERRLHVADPDVARLDHVDVAVHDAEAVLRHVLPPGGIRESAAYHARAPSRGTLRG